MYFPLESYWDQWQASLGELSTNVEQLKVEHQEHSITLNEIREDQRAIKEDQRAMREEQQRQMSDIEEIKHHIGSSRRSTSRHH
ncbi:hypothetical protein DRJ72_14610 [Enterococcus faecalis]